MAIVIDQADLGGKQAVSGTLTTVAMTTTQAVAAGGFVVVCVSGLGGSQVTGVSGGGLSWTVDKTYDGSGGGGGRGLGIASAQCAAGLASGATFTATFLSAADGRCIGGMSFTGVATSSPVDTTNGPNNASATAAWATGSTAVAAGSVLIANCYTVDTASGNTPTAPSLEAFECANVTDGYSMPAEYRIEAGAGSVTVAGTFGASAATSNIAVAYLAAAGAATGNIAWVRG